MGAAARIAMAEKRAHGAWMVESDDFVGGKSVTWRSAGRGLGGTGVATVGDSKCDASTVTAAFEPTLFLRSSRICH